MGNQSEKKIAQFKQKVQNYYFYPTIVICVLFILYNVYSEYLLSISGILVTFLVVGIQYFCYNQIMRSLELGLDDDAYSIYIDILGLNGIIMLGSLFTDKVWYGYLIFPGILIYKCGKIVWGWLQKDQYVEVKKKDSKKEKDKKVKYIK